MSCPPIEEIEHVKLGLAQLPNALAHKRLFVIE